MKMYGFLAILICSLCGLLCGQTFSPPSEVVEQYDSFPNDWRTVSQFKGEAKRLQDNNLQEARRLSDEMQMRETKDPDFQKLSISDGDNLGEIISNWHKPYNHNRLGRKNSSIYLCASEVHTKYQDFILTSCPRSKEEFVGLLSCFLDRIDEQGLWVSLLCSSEAPNYCNNFWKADFLHRLKLPNGWAISKVTSSVIGGKPSEPNTPFLMKTLIELSSGTSLKTIIHYHYDGWRDHTTVPDEALLLTLLDEMDANAKKEVPIVINCIAGIGRTGMTTVTYLLRKEIQAQISSGVAKENVRINVPTTIYNLRKQRASLVNNPEHVPKIYSVLETYCERV